MVRHPMRQGRGLLNSKPVADPSQAISAAALQGPAATTLSQAQPGSLTHPSASMRGIALTSRQWCAGVGCRLATKLSRWPGRGCSPRMTQPRAPGEWHSVASWLAYRVPTGSRGRACQAGQYQQPPSIQFAARSPQAGRQAGRPCAPLCQVGELAVSLTRREWCGGGVAAIKLGWVGAKHKPVVLCMHANGQPACQHPWWVLPAAALASKYTHSMQHGDTHTSAGTHNMARSHL